MSCHEMWKAETPERCAKSFGALPLRDVTHLTGKIEFGISGYPVLQILPRGPSICLPDHRRRAEVPFSTVHL